MSRIDLGAKTLVFPMPALAIATYNEDGSVNVMLAAWGGICQETPAGIMIDLAKDHKTTANILRSGAFTVSFATADTIAASDYFGIVSGNKEPKKFEKSGFHAVKSAHVDAPIVEEYKVALECKLFTTHEMPNDLQVVGEIVNVSADESVMTNGKLDAAKLQPLAWNPVSHEYVKLGEVVGLAWNIGKPYLK